MYSAGTAGSPSSPLADTHARNSAAVSAGATASYQSPRSQFPLVESRPSNSRPGEALARMSDSYLQLIR